jgi:hypothetical protein
MVCNFLTHAKQLALFNETGTIMVRRNVLIRVFPLLTTFSLYRLAFSRMRL